MTRHRSRTQPVGLASQSRASRIAASLLDVITISLCVLALGALAERDFQVSFGAVTLSMKSWWRVALWAGLASALRHLVWPSPSLAARIRRAAEHFGASAALHGAFWSAGVSSRLVVLIIAWVAATMVAAEPGGRPPSGSVQGSPFVERGELMTHRDTAVSGYRGAELTPQSFPLLPLIFRFGLLMTRPTVVGMFFAIGCFLWAFLYLYRLARFDLNADAALGAVAFLAAWPFAAFFSLPSVDAVLLLGAVGAFYHLRRDERVRAGAWGLVAGFTSAAGVFLAVPLVFVAFSRGSWQHRSPPRSLVGTVLVALMPVVAFLAVMASLAARTSRSFPGVIAGFLEPRLFSLTAFLGGPPHDFGSAGLLQAIERAPLTALDFAAVILVLALIWPIGRRFGAAYASVLIVGLLSCLVLGAPTSAGRASALLFPVFLYFGASVRPAHQWGWLACFAMLQAVIACALFAGRQNF